MSFQVIISERKTKFTAQPSGNLPYLAFYRRIHSRFYPSFPACPLELSLPIFVAKSIVAKSIVALTIPNLVSTPIPPRDLFLSRIFST